MLHNPAVSSELQSELEQLLAQVVEHVRSLREEFNTKRGGATAGKPQLMPESVARIVWAKQLESSVLFIMVFNLFSSLYYLLYSSLG